MFSKIKIASAAKVFKFAILMVVLSTGTIAENITRDTAPGSCTGVFPFAETTAAYEDFNFWLGSWLVVDTVTKQLVGYDTISLEEDGCVVKQIHVPLADNYNVPETNWRLSGQSISGIKTGGEWRHLWIDNAGNNWVLTGGRQLDGAMKFTSEALSWTQDGQSFTNRYRWYWKALPGGRVHNWGFFVGDDGKDAQVMFDFTFLPNIKGTDMFKLTPVAETN